MKPLRLQLQHWHSVALMGNAQAVTTIPFWHSMEGELGKEVDSLAQRFNAKNADYKLYRPIKATTNRI